MEKKPTAEKKNSVVYTLFLEKNKNNKNKKKKRNYNLSSTVVYKTKQKLRFRDKILILWERTFKVSCFHDAFTHFRCAPPVLRTSTMWRNRGKVQWVHKYNIHRKLAATSSYCRHSHFLHSILTVSRILYSLTFASSEPRVHTFVQNTENMSSPLRNCWLVAY
jgi:hypothetical protein